MKTIDSYLTIKDFYEILFEGKKIAISQSLIERVNGSYDFLKSYSANKVIYGVNTGFGPMAQYRIQEGDQLQLQYNLIRSHASGTGHALSVTQVKATMLARLNTLSLGKSGIHISVVELMRS